jgi:serine/threonine-protein kinase
MLARWPEYREATGDLRGLVVRYIEPNSGFEVPEGSKVSSVPEGSFSGLQGLDYGHDSGHYSDPQLSAAATEPTGTELTAEQVVAWDSSAHAVPVPAPRERPRRGLAFVLAGVGVVAALGLGVLLVDRDDEQELAREQAEPEPPASKPEPVKVAAPEPAQPQPQQLQPQPRPPGPSDELAEADDDDEDDEDTEQVATERVKVPVEFVANEFFFVYVKVSGRVLTLEPRDQLELPEGKHTVYLRQSPDEKWTRAGRITIAPGNEYRVEMRKPAGLQLVKK